MQSADRPTRLQWNLNFINIKVADNVDLDLQICILSPCSSDGKLRGDWFKAYSDLHTVSTLCECHTWTSIFNNTDWRLILIETVPHFFCPMDIFNHRRWPRRHLCFSFNRPISDSCRKKYMLNVSNYFGWNRPVVVRLCLVRFTKQNPKWNTELNLTGCSCA